MDYFSAFATVLVSLFSCCVRLVFFSCVFMVSHSPKWWPYEMSVVFVCTGARPHFLSNSDETWYLVRCLLLVCCNKFEPTPTSRSCGIQCQVAKSAICKICPPPKILVGQPIWIQIMNLHVALWSHFSTYFLIFAWDAFKAGWNGNLIVKYI